MASAVEAVRNKSLLFNSSNSVLNLMKTFYSDL